MKLRMILVCCAALALTVGVATVAAAPTPVVVASGLDSPRHLTFSSTGELYVVEAGRGGAAPCANNPELGLMCFGLTGAVTQVNDNGSDPRVVTGLPSISGSNTFGPSDIDITGGQKFVLSIGLAGDPAFRDAFGAQGALLGTLVSGKLKKPGVTLFADVAANEAAANPDGTDINSNPTGLTRDGEGYYVTDSGGNAVVRASHKGTFTTLTALPPVSVLPPFDPADAVPTSVVQGPDRAYYISELTGFPFQAGTASIFRVVPGQAATVYASGLTNVTDLAFAPNGSLYAVEIASAGLLNGPIGSLVKITPGGSVHETVIGGLFAPYGVAFGRGNAYVSTGSVSIGGGQVISIPLG